MTPPGSPPSRSPGPGWALEVVRGVRVGQRYPVGAGRTVLGSARTTARGAAMLCLADQEGASPRRMAALHVGLDQAEGGLRLTDLASPGGTFVNNRRILPGPSTQLADDDIIQLGAVQLRVTRGAAAGSEPPAAPPVRAAAAVAPVVASFAYRTGTSGAICRTWDDFLPLSAQKWDELSADLVSGRLAEFVASVGRPDLAPDPPRASPVGAVADERLHDWLGRLPTRTPAAPELEVHPLRLVVAVPGGGVTVVRKVRLSNVGYGLMAARVRIEQPSGATFALAGHSGGDIVVRDSVDVAVEVAVPDRFVEAGSAQLVVTGAGVERRVAIVVERRTPAAAPEPGATDLDPAAGLLPRPLARFRALSPGKRATIAALIGLASRLLIGVAGGAIGEDALLPSGPDVPGLAGVVAAFGLAGAGLGGWWLGRRGGWGDVGSGAVAGAGLGFLLAAAAVAACRAIEPTLGPVLGSPLAAFGAWAAGAGLLGILIRAESVS